MSFVRNNFNTTIYKNSILADLEYSCEQINSSSNLSLISFECYIEKNNLRVKYNSSIKYRDISSTIITSIAINGTMTFKNSKSKIYQWYVERKIESGGNASEQGSYYQNNWIENEWGYLSPGINYANPDEINPDINNIYPGYHLTFYDNNQELNLLLSKYDWTSVQIG